MFLASPDPLLTPPPSSSPPKTPHRPYSAQTRAQNEEKNLPPKPYLPLQTRTRHRQSHRPHVPMLMRGTPPTMRYHWKLVGGSDSIPSISVYQRPKWGRKIRPQVGYRGQKRGRKIVRRSQRAQSDCPTTRDRGASLTLVRLE